MEIEIMFSKHSKVDGADYALGVSDGVYYIQKNNGYWEEIPVDLEEEAMTYFENL